MTQSLKLIPANESRDGGPWSADDYDVVLVDAGKKVGRVFRQTVAPGNPNEWFWGLDFFEAKGRRPFYGSAESKDAAKRSFAECWRSSTSDPEQTQRVGQTVYPFRTRVR